MLAGVHVRYTRGVRLEEGQFEQMAELQLDTKALQRGTLEIAILKFPDDKERVDHNLLSIRRTDARWEIMRTREADEQQKHLIIYTEWVAIEGRVGDPPIGEQEGETRWYFREKRSIEEKWKRLRELGFFPVKGPVRTSAGEPGLGNLGQEADSIPGAEIE